MKNMSLNPMNNLGSLIEDLFNGRNPEIFKDDLLPEYFKAQNRQIPVNITETKDGYQLELVAPGIKKEDMKVQVKENALTISFENKKQEEKEEKNEDGTKILRHEFRQESFERSFRLGEKVDADKISASYENGILKLSIPKKEPEQVANKLIQIA